MKLCLQCGWPRSEHAYNGACYGLCGKFVERTPMDDADKIREWRVAMSAAVAALSRWLAHQYGQQEQYTVLNQVRDDLRAALEK